MVNRDRAVVNGRLRQRLRRLELNGVVPRNEIAQRERLVESVSGVDDLAPNAATTAITSETAEAENSPVPGVRSLFWTWLTISTENEQLAVCQRRKPPRSVEKGSRVFGFHGSIACGRRR